jgi:hypothetical protein
MRPTAPPKKQFLRRRVVGSIFWIWWLLPVILGKRVHVSPCRDTTIRLRQKYKSRSLHFEYPLDESAMLSIIDKLFDKLPLFITTLETNRFGAKMLAVFIGFAVVTFALYVVLKLLP